MNVKKITTRKAWTDLDNRAIIDLYDIFLTYQQCGTKYTKAPIVRAYAEELGRSKGSVECKLMNLSAIRKDLGLDWVTGYKPLSNYNKDLFNMVKDSL